MIEKYYSKLATQSMASSPSSIVIGGPVEDALEQIKSILAERKKQVKQQLDDFNSFTIKPPLSMCVDMFFGANIFNYFEYIFNIGIRTFNYSNIFKIFESFARSLYSIIINIKCK